VEIGQGSASNVRDDTTFSLPVTSNYYSNDHVGINEVLGLFNSHESTYDPPFRKQQRGLNLNFENLVKMQHTPRQKK